MSVAADALPAALRVVPSLADAKALAATHNLIPVCHTFTEDCETPVSAFLKLRDMALMLTDVLVTFDHLKHTVSILANADISPDGDLERAYAAASATIAEVRAQLAAPVPRFEPASRPRAMPSLRANMPRERFEGMVERIVEYI